MSLILDALRKSEAERRRGQAPDMYSAAPISLSSRRIDPLRLWPVLVFAVLVAIAGVVFWRGPAGATAVPAVADATSNQLEEADAAIATDQKANPRSAASPSNAPPRKTDDSGQTRPPAPVAASRGPATGPNQLAQSPLPPTAPFAPMNDAAPPADPDADDNGAAPPSLAVLEASERAALPPLKLSMHVWASEPAKRFAIVDGQRVTEGSSLGAGVVALIRRDGVVIEVNGRRFLLPRP